MSLPVGSRFPAVSVSIPEFNVDKQGKSMASQSEVSAYFPLLQPELLMRRLLLYIQIYHGAASDATNIGKSILKNQL